MFNDTQAQNKITTGCQTNGIYIFALRYDLRAMQMLWSMTA